MKDAGSMIIIVDTREQRPWTFGGRLHMEHAALPAGDYSLAGFETSVAIERKSLDDLVQSVTWERERFLRECERLRAYELKTILVEAGVPDVWAHRYRSRTMPQAVIASALAIEQDFGISTTWAGSRESAEKIAALILSRFHRKRGEVRDAR
ncbi:ERCC4 domain-containing protein [Sorangium atrum]|uniref:ERCC4 domain-containing protein n=1 Tax=Sorangium atrum TaxID=2995308 RepID=A0ABT5C1Q7_9BACT|nr:ERCC4 domain-containing protein [Sorangium aterium]MDC0679694.1 ERCC4 domain-containing protein [Sorangium aterium]